MWRYVVGFQAAVELESYGGVVWPDSLPGPLVERTGLQQMCSCLTASTARALLCRANRLICLVVKASFLESGRSRVPIPLAPGFFPGSSHTSDLKTGTPVATLPGAWRYRVSAGTGRPGVGDWVSWKVGSATSISVWQHVKLSEQIRS